MIDMKVEPGFKYQVKKYKIRDNHGCNKIGSNNLQFKINTQ